MNKKIIIANWKAHPETFEEAQELFKAEILAAEKYPNAKMVICPPTAFLERLAETYRVPLSTGAPCRLGAQDVFWESKPDFPISHVLVGHSDRRYGLGEIDEVINQKLKRTLKDGVTPILLVGEREGELKEEILTAQLTKDLVGLSSEEVVKVLFCYEPVWAISTNLGGHPDTPENALEAIRFIDSFLTKNYKLTTNNYLYGGSVNENNVADFLQHPEMSGAVVGAASLHVDQFTKILEIVSNI